MKNSKLISFLFTIMFVLVLGASSSLARETGNVTGTTVRVRYEPNTTSSIVFNVYKKDIVEILGENDEWYKITYENQVGWISKQYISVIANKGVDKSVTDNTDLLILPAINSKPKATINKGETVKVIEVLNGWANVEYNALCGWIRESKLKSENSQSSNTNNASGKTVYVNASNSRIREKANTSSNIIDTLPKDVKLTVIEEEGDWYKVKFDNKTGYIMKNLTRTTKTNSISRAGNITDKTLQTMVNDANEQPIKNEENKNLSVNDTSSKGNEVVKYAKQFLGYKYVYGAAGPTSFDCSGLTMYVYKNFGVSLPHSSKAQASVGKNVTKSELQAGDLVFFTQTGGGSEIGHVGIYIGDNQFIHASTPSTGVKYSSLSSDGYIKRYVTARRVL